MNRKSPFWRNALVRLSTPQAVMIIAALSLAVKLGYIFVLGGGLDAFPKEGSDVEFYDAAARNLLATSVYGDHPGIPTTGMPPGQSAFLALLYLVSNYSIAFAKLAHVLLMTCVAVLTYVTGKELAGTPVGFWAGVLVAIDPAQAYLAGTFLSEPLFIFLMLLAIYCLIRQRSRFQWGWLIAAGVGFGLAGLTRNQGWLFVVALVLGTIVLRGRLMPLKAAAVVLVACVAIIAPWTWRNYMETGQFIPVSSEGGLTLWASNNPEFIFRQPMPMSLPVYQIQPGLSGSEIDSTYRQRAVDWILSHPMDFVAIGFRKVIILYHFDPSSWRPEVAGLYRLAGIVPYGILLPFIIIGLIRHSVDEKYRIISGYIFFTTAMAFVFYGDSRIRAPIQPYLYIFGMLGIQWTAQWVSEYFRLRRESSPTGSV